MSRWQRAQRLGAGLLLVGSLAFLVARGSCSPDVPFISQSGPVRWIAPPFAVSAQLHQWGHERVPVARYARRLAGLPDRRPALLEVRAFGEFSVYHNAVRVAHFEAGDFRRFRRVELASASPGDELVVEVANRHGPPLLSLRIGPIRSDPSWRVSWDGAELGHAVIASDTQINPLAYAVESPLDALADARVAVAAFFGVGVVAFLVLSRRPGGGQRTEFALLGAAAVGWIFLFARKFVGIPLQVGFDARHHLYYIEFLREHTAVPLATDGWSVYHPPLFYALAGLAEWLGEALAGEGGGEVGLKAIPFLAGFGNVWLAGALCRRLGLGTSARFGLVFAAVLPMNVYSAAYFSNETFHTFVAGLAILCTVDLLLAPQSARARVALLGALLGLCLITKFTAILVGSVCGFFLLVKWLAVERVAPTRALTRLASVGALAAAIGGWFYLRNWLHYGDPLMANWGSMPGPTLAWWQHPGFHTLSYFTGFGESLRHPYLSAFHSFWDSVYSTLWGDGGIAGRVSPADRPTVWNYTFMSLGYLAALPATGLIAGGGLRAAKLALCDPSPQRRAVFSFLLTLSYAVLFGLLYLALRLPYFAQGKATYGLVVTAPLAALFALGADWLDGACRARRWLALRALFYGWFAVFIAALFLAFAG